MSSITIASRFGNVGIVNEPTYSFGSGDNLRRYEQEKNLQEVYRPTSVHGVFLDDEPLAVFGAAGGCSAVHRHSALVLDSKLYLAVGDSLVCFALDDRQFCWATVLDPATCFGIYYETERDALISHGELEVARIDKKGNVLWASSGADIFSEGFRLEKKFIAVTDFDKREYHFSYENGSAL
jgi:hypothetical protein